ncbi:sel1 repeat family protein [Massilia atriviolacea]|uniref:Sel1 repeat family protein n=1 Tax=Massilia atriviolacea TaxID=2495579 RepID=A0A430HPA2_9BURK|nr:sel1 repeat family protein [Massilia atriviolacea]RSZ59339.1 sel1 repeat family protein [Massilia atriviolacea]
MKQDEKNSRLLKAHADLLAGRYDAARAVFEELGALGDDRALLYLGSMHERGLGGPVDEVRAAALFKKSCDGGNSTSCFFLGMLQYRNRDLAAALESYCLAAAAGHPAAAYWIAQIYGDTSHAIADNVEEMRYLEIADRGGHAFAARDLAKKRMHASGSIMSKLLARAQYINAIIKGIMIIARDADDPRVQ